MRTNEMDFEPFLCLEDGVTYESYCRDIENTATWGGQLEVKINQHSSIYKIRALAMHLHVAIQVYQVFGGESVVMNDNDKHNGLLRLS